MKTRDGSTEHSCPKSSTCLGPMKSSINSLHSMRTSGFERRHPSRVEHRVEPLAVGTVVLTVQVQRHQRAAARRG